jgi:hypothetical protein
MQTRHRRVHLRIWIGMALLLPAILLAGFVLRQSGPADPPVRIAAP